MDPELSTAIAVFSSLGSAAGLGWWLSGQIQGIKDAFGAKLAAHEKEDAERFRKTELHLQRLDLKRHT